MPTPTNKPELQRFLGMVNYLGKFVPQLSNTTAPLRKLLEKDVVYYITEQQVQAVQDIKKIITSPPVLKFYNPNCSLRVKADASTEGLGAVFEQYEDKHWYPVAYASRSLSDAEKRYAQIEKVTLSIVFATKRFHEYIYG